MKHIRITLLPIVITCLLAGCGAEFAYKRGATAADLKKQKAHCQSASSPTALNQCLEKAGWTVLDQSDEDLFITPSVTSKNARVKQTATPEATIKQAEIKQTEKQATKPSLLDTYVIKSWWKMGANGDALSRDMNSCETQLSEAHQPNKKTFTFTRAYVMCMRENGWRALVER